MARKSKKTGKFIVSAGEISQYVYCPESWKLRESHRVPEFVSINEQSDRDEGLELHTAWSKDLDSAAHLNEGLRFLCALVITMVVIVIAY